jgi:hypothetical protein
MVEVLRERGLHRLPERIEGRNEFSELTVSARLTCLRGSAPIGCRCRNVVEERPQQRSMLDVFVARYNPKVQRTGNQRGARSTVKTREQPFVGVQGDG